MISILIIDDDQATRESLQAMLKKSFYSDIAIAPNAGSALMLIARRPFEVVLLDLKLPDTDGLEFIPTLKRLNPLSEIVIITGYGGQEIAIQSLRKGAIDYIEKPIRTEDLMAAIGRAGEKLQDKKTLSRKNAILVSDGDTATTDPLRRALRQAGCDVAVARTDREAFAVLDERKIDVIVTDIVIDDSSAIDFLLQAKKVQPDAEEIVIAGKSDGEFVVKALKSGASACLLKPVRPDVLLIEVGRALEKITLRRNTMYRNRELKITSEIMTKVNEELEKRIEERSLQLSKTQAQLFQTSKLATLGEMSAGLAHELNQPLGAIALTTRYLKRLCEGGNLSHEELCKSITDIDASIQRMTKVIQHMRTFARQDALKFEEVNLNDTMNAALELLGEQFRLHEVLVVVDLAPGPATIIGEPFQLEQVWLNLLVNARHAVDERAVRARVRPGEPVYEKRLDVASGYAGGRIFMEVRDNGVGMSDEVKNRIFEPFFTTKEVGQALGLGMSISYGIVESHHGKIEIESREGAGSAVRVLFDPIAKNVAHPRH